MTSTKLDQLKALGDAKRKERNPFEDAARGRDIEPKKPNKIIEGLKEAVAVARGEIEPAKLTVLKRGRPKIVELRPWETEGISRRTWYRRQKDKSK